MKRLSWFYAPHFFSFLCLLSVLSFQANATQSSLAAKESLISFVPSIISPLRVECQGLRINKLLVATSPRCVQKIRQTLKKRENIGVLSTEATIIGSLSTCNKSLPAQTADINLFLAIVPNDEYQSEPAYYTSEYPPEKAFAHYLNDQNAVSIEEVSLTSPDFPHQKGYLALKSENQLPEGSPVYDVHGHVVCLITSEDECRTFPDSLTQPFKGYGLDISIDYSVAALTIIGGILLVISKNGGATALKSCLLLGVSFLTVIWTALFSRPEVICTLTGGYQSGSCNCH